MGNNQAWQNFNIKYRESNSSPIDDFHEHDYYEINFIVSGNVRILLPDSTDDSAESRILLTAPGTPHFVSCRQDLIYKRYYLLFSKEFIREFITEENPISHLLEKPWKIVSISSSQENFCRMLISKLEHETNVLRQKLLVMYLLSYIDEFANNDSTIKMPSYIMEAMTFIENQYNEKIVASDLAQMLHIGRTTLMTNFKKYTNLTLAEFINQCRLKNALTLLEEDKKESEIAEKCGFGDVSGFIRTFKKYFKTTPRKYIKEKSSV